MPLLKRILGIVAVIAFVTTGAYVGYLSALVDLDELRFIEEVKAVTDKQRLEHQLARAKSILEARQRAYIRRSQEFLKSLKQRKRAIPKSRLLPPLEPTPESQDVPESVSAEQPISPIFSEPPRSEPTEPLIPIPESMPPDMVEEADEVIFAFEPRIEELPQEEQVVMKALKEERKDLQFFEDEVKVIEEAIARIPPAEEVHAATRRGRGKRVVSNAVDRAFKIRDKQKQIADERKKTTAGFQYWQENPKAAPQAIEVTVSSKDSLKREINPLHATQISTALSLMPQGFENRLQRVYLVYGDPKMRRGMTGVGVVFMKGEELDLFRVLVHEFGHAYDLHREVSEGEKSEFYDGEYRLYSADPSVRYYQLAWKNSHDRAAELPGFTSQYGMTDPFEDFAEAFALYVLQGKTFGTWQEQQDVIRQKYAFLKNAFFDRAFRSTTLYTVRPYDVTMMGVNYEELLKP